MLCDETPAMVQLPFVCTILTNLAIHKETGPDTLGFRHEGPEFPHRNWKFAGFFSRAFGAPVSLISNIHEEIQGNVSVSISKT